MFKQVDAFSSGCSIFMGAGKLMFSVADAIFSWVQGSIFEDRQKKAKEMKNGTKGLVKGQNLSKI